jgi:hypothetical protein
MDEAREIIKEVEADDEEEEVDRIASALNENYHLLIPQLSFQKFIIENFCCKHFHGHFRDRSIQVDKIGFASNLFWDCPNKECPSSASILLTPTCQIKGSGKFRRKYPTTPRALSDYAINRQVVLACQQSGGGTQEWRLPLADCSLYQSA